MLQDKIVTIKIFPTNRKKYEERLDLKLTNGEKIKLRQDELLPTSRQLVSCKCDICDKHFERKRVDVKDRTFCGKICRNEFFKTVNPNLNIEKINVCCGICNKRFDVQPSKHKKQEDFFCSRGCYAQHRSDTYSGEKVYNYQDVFVNCATCKKNTKTSKWYTENKKHLFCSQGCYWKHRKKHYKEFYYEPNLRKNTQETEPERLVREWLELNNIRYKQEVGFLRKYYVDFYLSDYKVILEAYGDYWHIHPDIYDVNNDDSTKIKLSDQQIKILNTNNDQIRTEELESHGYKTFVLWETDLHNNRDLLMEETMQKIALKNQCQLST